MRNKFSLFFSSKNVNSRNNIHVKLMNSLRFLLVFLLFFPALVFSQANYDESKVPGFKLPDPLISFRQRKIRNVKQWEKTRRPELHDFFTKNMYGEIPGKLEISSFNILEQGDDAFNGKAKRRQVELTFEKGKHKIHFNILMYLPKGVEKAPLFLGYNFSGNHSVASDPHILISTAWVEDNPSLGIINNQFTEQSRGAKTNRWAIEKMLDAGFGLATIYYGEVDPDKEDYSDGVQPFFYVDDQKKPADNEWGSVAVWAWGLSRAMDYLEQDQDVDAQKVIVFGHSRLGKTALWAGVNDQRFAGVISNDSGCGGAALSKREFGETIKLINTSFPHWFCKNFKNYSGNEKALPVDQHEVLAMIAPRPLYVASAEDDQWADPGGEFLSVVYASPVYKLYGVQGITQTEMPAVNQPVMGPVAYHIRSGKHDVTEFDWEQYIRWAKQYIQ